MGHPLIVFDCYTYVFHFRSTWGPRTNKCQAKCSQDRILLDLALQLATPSAPTRPPKREHRPPTLRRLELWQLRHLATELRGHAGLPRLRPPVEEANGADNGHGGRARNPRNGRRSVGFRQTERLCWGARPGAALTH